MSPMRRRGLFGGALALAAVPAVQVTAQSPHPDAGLLDLGRQLTEVQAREKAAWALADQEDVDDGPNGLQAVALGVTCADIAGRIEALQAVSLPGLLVKLQAFLWCHCGDPITPDMFAFMDPPPRSARLVSGLLQDLSGMGRTVA